MVRDMGRSVWESDSFVVDAGGGFFVACAPGESRMDVSVPFGAKRSFAGLLLWEKT